VSEQIDKTGSLEEAMAHAKTLLDRDPEQALSQLEEIMAAVPEYPPALHLQALAFGALQRGEQAITVLEKVVSLNPDHPEAWRLLADHAAAIGDKEKSERAYLRHLQCSAQNADLQQAAAAMITNDLPIAERRLKAYLKQAPTDVAAIRMLAEVAVRSDETRMLWHYSNTA